MEIPLHVYLLTNLERNRNGALPAVYDLLKQSMLHVLSKRFIAKTIYLRLASWSTCEDAGGNDLQTSAKLQLSSRHFHCLSTEQ